MFSTAVFGCHLYEAYCCNFITAELSDRESSAKSSPSKPGRKKRRDSDRVNQSTICDTCGHQADSAAAMARHVESKHAENLLTCNICFKEFSSSNQMDRHRRTHFDGDGCLSESAMLLHIEGLEKHRVEENLPEDLASQIQEYKQMLEDDSANKVTLVEGQEVLKGTVVKDMGKKHEQLQEKMAEEQGANHDGEDTFDSVETEEGSTQDTQDAKESPATNPGRKRGRKWKSEKTGAIDKGMERVLKDNNCTKP